MTRKDDNLKYTFSCLIITNNKIQFPSSIHLNRTSIYNCVNLTKQTTARKKEKQTNDILRYEKSRQIGLKY